MKMSFLDKIKHITPQKISKPTFDVQDYTVYK